MKTHDIKCAPEFFAALIDGRKTFEIRLNDRNYEVGDILHIAEFSSEGYTGRVLYKRVTYLTNFAQQAGYVVMAIGALY